MREIRNINKKEMVKTIIEIKSKNGIRLYGVSQFLYILNEWLFQDR